MIENPTQSELRTLKNIIYLITNKINNKNYVGKTRRRFSDRYTSCKWWKYSHSTYLKNAAYKHGIDKFQITILEYEITDIKTLLEKEAYYIEKYNCLYPHGYNFIKDSYKERIFTNELKMRIAISSAKGQTFTIKEISTNEIKTFKTKKEIKEKYKIKKQNLQDLLCKRLRTINGICLPETNLEKHSNNDQLIILLDQFDNQYKFYSCLKFAKEYKCCASCVQKVKSGCAISTKSKNGLIFRLLTIPKDNLAYFKSTNKINQNQKYKQIILTKISENLDYIINIPMDIKNFCNKNQINKKDIYTLTSGKQKTSKGFKLKQIILFTEN